MNQKTQILTALRAFVRQRPGFDPRNYISDWRDTAGRAAYRADSRRATKQRQDAERMIDVVEHWDAITAGALVYAARESFFGRLSLTISDSGKVAVRYCAGQYWPTEYRAAVCAVLASAIWAAHRADCPDLDGDGLRASFRNWFGAGMAGRWFC